jgi:MarR family transcriptional regulator for hemolysin
MKLTSVPIGMDLFRTTKVLSQAFEARLAEVGGGLPTWLTLLSIKSQASANQRELADMIGIQGATLTHHLNAMEKQGLLTRRRDPANRRVHRVELTDAGEALFLRLRDVAVGFDKQLRAGIPDDRIAQVAATLATFRANVGD